MRSAAIDSLFTVKAVHNDGLHHAIHTRGLNLSRFTMNVAPIQLRSLWRLRTERVTEIIDRLPAAVFAVIPFIFFVVMAVGLVRWYTPVPFWDMWDAYLAAYIDYLDGNWRALFVQTNEHRIWFLDVLFYLDLTFFGGRSLLLVPFNGLLAVLTWAALAAVARHLLKDRPGLWPVTALALGPLCFSWLQEQNLSWGFQSQFFVAYLFPLAAFACLAMSFRPRGRAGSGGGERDPRWAGIRGLLRSFPGWRRGDRIGSTAAGTLAMLQGVAALMKMTYAVASFPVVILTDVARFARYRAPPVLTPLYLTAYLAAYLAAGQELSVLWAYLSAASEISGGYSEAMVEYAPIGEVAAFVFIAFAATAMIAHREVARNLRQTMDAALAMAVFGLLAFLAAKAGFVRHDIGHAVIAWAALALLTVTYLGDAVSRSAIRHRMGFAVLTLASLVYFSGAHLALIGRSEHADAVAMAEDTLNVLRDDVAAVARFTFGGHYSQLMREWPEFLKSIRDSHPLPPFTGTADIAGGDQAILLAHEADYRPRPVFQTYSVYTPGLIARNRDFLRSDRAPQTFLFKIAPIDGRFPALEEGALWPDLLRLYDAAPVAHGYTALTRRAVPREVSLEPIHETRVSFGQAVDISQWNDAVLWLELDLEPSWLGRLRNLLFKPPLVEIVTTLDDGRTLTHRLVPGMAHTGFVLSPFVDTTERFVDLKSAAGPRVVSVAFGPAKLDGTYYRGGIAFRLKRLRIGEP